MEIDDYINFSYLDEEGIAEFAGEIREYGRPQRFIEGINLPKVMKQGDEFVSIKSPIITLCRKIGIVKEFFSEPYFSIVKKIRVIFHWNRISIIGSSMEQPNQFLFNIPTKKNAKYSWYLKVICKEFCSTGFKPLYISIDTFHENIILKWFFFSIKVFALIALIIGTLIVTFYLDSDLVQEFIFKDMLKKESLTGLTTASPFLIILLLYLAFWKKIDETFKSFYEKKTTELNKNVDREGIKTFSNDFGIFVIEKEQIKKVECVKRSDNQNEQREKNEFIKKSEMEL